MGKPRSESDPQFEIAFYENILKRSPHFIEALIALGDLYTREGFYQKGLEIDRRLAELRPDDATVQYNLSCSYSLMNEVAKAREAMGRAFGLGYDDISHLERDPDLLNLLADTEFMEYLKQVRAELEQLPRGSGKATRGKSARRKAGEGV